MKSAYGPVLTDEKFEQGDSNLLDIETNDVVVPDATILVQKVVHDGSQKGRFTGENEACDCYQNGKCVGDQLA